MKNYRTIKYALLIISSVFAFYSCQKDEVEALEKRLAELELQVSIEDTVIFGDLVISSQESMNLFNDRRITNIFGTLYIENCIDLTPIGALRSVEGLTIMASEGLTSFEGLNNLKGAGFVELNFNATALVDVSALDNIESLNFLSLHGNIPSVSWFNKLNSVEHIDIYSNQSSLTISGFGSLSALEYLYISNYNGSLTIQGFGNLLTARSLSISAENASLGGLENIQSINNLHLGGNKIQLSGLNSISSMETLSLYGNSAEVNGLANLTTLQNLDISIQTSVSGLNKLTTVTDLLVLNIGSNDNFLKALTSIGRLVIYNYQNQNSTIKSIGDLGLTNLNYLGGLILDSPYLLSVDGFDFGNSNLEELSIYSCVGLTNISGLSSYGAVIGSLSLFNTELDNLNGLDNVSLINNMSIQDNRKLEDWCAIKDIFDNTPINQRYIQNNLINPASADDITGCG